MQFDLAEIRVTKEILRNCGGRGRNLNCNRRKVVIFTFKVILSGLHQFLSVCMYVWFAVLG